MIVRVLMFARRQGAKLRPSIGRNWQGVVDDRNASRANPNVGSTATGEGWKE
jgi:hypothetical protein